MTYEYHLSYWGEVNNDNWIERDLGIEEKDFWFGTKKDHNEFKAKLEAVADAHEVIIAFAEHEGDDVRKRTVARMVLTLPDGRSFSFDYDFGYGYSSEAAEYMFEDGNYACDCNRSIMLSKLHPEVVEMDCGDAILMSDFVVEKV